MLKHGARIFLILLVALFLYGLGRFAFFRFSSGEIYPQYSSLRTDPFGTKALYQSLKDFDHLSVTRNLEPLRKLADGAKTTVFVLGSAPEAAISNSLKEAESLAREGARVVLALNATTSKTQAREAERVNMLRPKSEKTAPPTLIPGQLRIKLIDPLRADTNRLEASRVADIIAPEVIPWYGRYCFERDAEWESIYEVKHKPVVVQRKIGLGTLVACADSFPFSNEALARDRSSGFLLWSAGSASKIIFDETHLGLARGQSVVVLLREYRLTGLFFGLLVLAALWIWKNASIFIPVYPEPNSKTEAVEGKTSRAGIVHLLEQNLALDQLPAVCLQEWSKAQVSTGALDAVRLREAEAALTKYQELPTRNKDPLKIYHQITKILHR